MTGVVESTAAQRAHALFSSDLGAIEGTSDWFRVTQDQVDAFAEVTLDRQWIHVDPELAARQSPFGGTIAHGFLTLSMLPHLMASIPTPADRLDGIAMGVNYGFEKVRFVSPVRVGSRIRATSAVTSAELRDDRTIQLVRRITVEVEGADKPAVVADWIARLVYA